MAKPLTTQTKLYVGLITAIGLACIVPALATWHTENLSVFLGILLVSMVASTLKVRLPAVTGTISVSFLFVLIGVLELSFGETLVLGCASAIVQFGWRSKSRPNPVRFTFNLSEMALSGAAAWLFYNATPLQEHVSPPLLLGLTACVYFAANTVPVAVVIALAERKPLLTTWKSCYFWTFPYYLIGAIVAGGISYTTRTFGWPSALMILPLIFIIYRSYRLYLDRLLAEKDHARLLSERSEELEREIAERKRTEITLRESQERYRTLFESSPHPMWVYDENTLAFIEVNDAAILRYGYSAADFHLMKVSELADDQPGAEVTTAGTPGLQRHRTKSGEAFDVEVRSHPVAFGEQNYTLVLADDITERRRAEELRVEKDAAEAASRSKSEFLANMSHELRTPLNAVLGYSELLQEQAVDDGQEEIVSDLSKIHSAGKHLLGLINDILDLSKIEAGKMELCLDEFDIVGVVHSAVNTVEPLIAKNRNTFEIDCPENTGFMYNDMTKTKQVLVNLLSNAAKFTQDGEIVLRVRQGIGPDTDMIQFVVEDKGIGMTLEDVQKIGRPFTQADPSTTRKYGGTGLGLVISKQFCEMMGGFITVESELGQGSTFVIHLPRTAADADSPVCATSSAGSDPEAGKDPVPA